MLWQTDALVDGRYCGVGMDALAHGTDSGKSTATTNYLLLPPLRAGGSWVKALFRVPESEE